MSSLIVAGFVFLHGAIHLSFLAPTPPAMADGPAWPFDLHGSWLLARSDTSQRFARPLGLALTAVTFAAFTLAAMAIVGLAPHVVGDAFVVLGAGSSMALLMLFFHPWLVLGLVIDIALLWAASIAGWAPPPV